MANKIKYGFRNVHYAVITETDNTITYGNPVSLNGGVNVTLSPAGDKTEFYADDVKYFSATTNNGYEGSIELADLPDSFKKDVLGWTEDTNGALVENADVLPKKFALGFEVQGDDKARRTWYFYCDVTRPSDDASTKGSTTEPKTATLNLTISPRPTDKVVKAVMQSDGTGYSTFFNTVYTV